MNVNAQRLVLVGIACVVMAVLGHRIGRNDARADDAEALSANAPAIEKKSPKRSVAGNDESSDTPVSIARLPSGARARYAELASRAENDRAAATELSEWLGTCTGIPREGESLTMTQAWLVRGSRSSMPRPSAEAHFRKLLDETKQQINRHRADCAGLTHDQLAMRAHWLYRAAVLGDIPSAHRFGTGEFLVDDLPGFVDEIPFWRDHAAEALGLALEGGDAGVLETLANAYDPVSTDAGVPPFDPDPELAYAYYSVMLMIGDEGMIQMIAPALDRLEAVLDADQLAAASMRAASICADDLPSQCDRAARN